MGIKVTTRDDEKKAMYPCLKISLDTHIIVMFHKRDTGTVVANPTNLSEVGYHSLSWSEDGFTPYTGTVELRNE